MLKFLLAAAPYVMSMSGKTSRKIVASRLIALALFALGGFALLIALFVWTAPRFGVDTAWLVTGIVLLITAAIFFAQSRKEVPVRSNSVSRKLTALTQPNSSTIDDDPLGVLMPESIKSDPSVRKVIRKISENPVLASAAALAVGAFIAREFFGD